MVAKMAVGMAEALALPVLQAPQAAQEYGVVAMLAQGKETVEIVLKLFAGGHGFSSGGDHSRKAVGRRKSDD